jgi:hypothetical protein
VRTTPAASTGDVTTTAEKKTRKNNRKEENGNPKRHTRRSKVNAMEMSVTVEDNDRNEQKEISLHNVEMSETQLLQDQVCNLLDDKTIKI